MEGVSTKASEKGLKFDQLPLDVLLVVFDLLDLQALAALSVTCRRLNSAINDEYLNVKSFSLLVTNQFSVEVQKRSLQLLSPIKKYYTNYRWRKKCYVERIFLHSVEKFRPWLTLQDKRLFVSRGKDIYLYARNRNGISQHPLAAYRGHTDDINRFVVRDNIMMSSGNDGKICCWDIQTGRICFTATNSVAWNESVYMDWTGRMLAAGFNMAGVVKFFYFYGDSGFEFRSMIKQNERVWSVALNEDGTSCSIGLAGYYSSPLKIYDLHRGVVTLSVPKQYKTGAGVFHALWESPQILISGSYDTYVRLWDLRTGNCVRSWSDPYDAAIYSLASDSHNTILAGTAVHGRVTLWDKRLPSCVQTYYMSKRMDCGPVYSLDFDPSYMFVALESSLHVLNF